MHNCVDVAICEFASSHVDSKSEMPEEICPIISHWTSMIP